MYACESPIKSWKLRELCEWVRKFVRIYGKMRETDRQREREYVCNEYE